MNADDGTFSARGAFNWFVNWQSQMFRLVGAVWCDQMMAGCWFRTVNPLFCRIDWCGVNIGLDFSEKGKSTLAMPVGLTGFVAHF